MGGGLRDRGSMDKQPLWWKKKRKGTLTKLRDPQNEGE